MDEPLDVRRANLTFIDGDHDIFGDGSVRLIYAPGHTPGHQALLVNLENTGPVIVSPRTRNRCLLSVIFTVTPVSQFAHPSNTHEISMLLTPAWKMPHLLIPSSSGAGPGSAGSADIEEFFERFCIDAGVPFKGTDFDGQSVHGPFSAVGIPGDGLFTVSEVVTPPEEAAIWGGVAGEQYHQYYHLACDTFDTISIEALEINSAAAAAAILQFGMNTEAINGSEARATLKHCEAPACSPSHCASPAWPGPH